jgi:hypothetical protein
MTSYTSHFAQEDPPNIEYFGITPEMAEYAFRTAPTLTGYEIKLMPINTLEEALVTAQEHAAHLKAMGEANARERGAILVISSLQEITPEELAEKLHRERATCLFMKVRMPNGATLYELLRGYYEPRSGFEPQST